MNYNEFLNYIKKHGFTVKQIEKELGYSPKSIQINWKKKDKVPDKALKTIYTHLQQKEGNNQINNSLINDLNQIQLPKHIYKLANEKSIKCGITIEEYLSSLIISNI